MYPLGVKCVSNHASEGQASEDGRGSAKDLTSDAGGSTRSGDGSAVEVCCITGIFQFVARSSFGVSSRGEREGRKLGVAGADYANRGRLMSAAHYADASNGRTERGCENCACLSVVDVGCA